MVASTADSTAVSRTDSEPVTSRSIRKSANAAPAAVAALSAASANVRRGRARKAWSICRSAFIEGFNEGFNDTPPPYAGPGCELVRLSTCTGSMGSAGTKPKICP